MAKAHVRLDKDVAAIVRKTAKANSRSLAQEVNHTLRAVLVKGTAKGPTIDVAASWFLKPASARGANFIQ
jgi:hypothetical protein